MEIPLIETNAKHTNDDLPKVHRVPDSSRRMSENEQVTVEIEASFVPSIDLVRCAQGHLAFLKKIGRISHYLKQPHVIANAMRRYENYWLPMISQYADRDSSSFHPPIDVHWIWYVHMLCPRQYRNDCIDVIGMVPDHRFIQGELEITSAQVKTQKLWMSFCVGENYSIDFSQIDVETTYHKTSIRYQLAEASYRQLAFNYHVSLSHYPSPSFLELATQRYLKFINLKRLYKGAVLNPGYDMFLIWHSHQLSPRAYIHDTSHWLGYILNNDDPNDTQGKHNKYIMSEEESLKVWNELYSENFNTPGSNHRGIDPSGKLGVMTSDQIKQFRSNGIKFSFNSVIFDETYYTSSTKGTMTVSLNRLQSEWYEVKKSQVQYVLPLKPTPPPFIWKVESPNVKDIVIDESGKLYLSVQIQTKSSAGCCSTKWTDDAKLDLASQTLSTYVNTEEIKHFTFEQGSIKVALQGCLQEIPMIFTIQQTGSFKQTLLTPENKDQLISPVISLPETTKKTEHVCQEATHIIKSQSGSTFAVRITHSLSLRNSIVQVYFGNQLISVSHVIDREQLPTPEQVDNAVDCFSISPTKTEPAMIIKNNQGDWAILKGRWLGYNTVKQPGHLIVDAVSLGGERLHKHISVLAKTTGLTELTRDTFVDLGQARVDLKTGHIAMTGDCQSFAEHIAMSFSILILYILCEPRPGDKPGANRQESVMMGKQGNDLNPCNFSLMEAAGCYVDTPSSSFLWWLWNENRKSGTGRSNQDDNNNDDVMECPWQPINDATQDERDNGVITEVQQSNEQDGLLPYERVTGNLQKYHETNETSCLNENGIENQSYLLHPSTSVTQSIEEDIITEFEKL